MWLKSLHVEVAAGEGTEDMSNVADLHEKWSRDPEYRAAYDRLGPEFEIVAALIEARARRTHGNDAIRGGAARKRPGAPFHPDAGEIRPGDRHPAPHRLRSGVRE